MRRIVCVIALVFMLCNTVMAEPPVPQYAVIGYVKNQSGTALNGASVTVRHYDSGAATLKETLTASTNQNGQYEVHLTNASNSDYITVSAASGTQTGQGSGRVNTSDAYLRIDITVRAAGGGGTPPPSSPPSSPPSTITPSQPTQTGWNNEMTMLVIAITLIVAAIILTVSSKLSKPPRIAKRLKARK